MSIFKNVSLGTNLFKDYTLERALELIKEYGFAYAELASIFNFCEHIEPKQINPEFCEQVKQLLDRVGLKCYAFSGHLDPTIEEQCRDLMKKIEFAGRIGASIVNTNSGPVERLDEFHKNMPRLIKEAEKWNVIIGLESHGDIVNTAKDSVHIFKYYNHPLVRLNYDTGNTLFYNPGQVKIEEDIKYGFEYLVHLHLKDIRISGNSVAYMPIGQGDINFPAVFETLKSFGRPIPCCYEIPVHAKGVLGNIAPTGTPLPETEIRAAVTSSLAYVDSLLK